MRFFATKLSGRSHGSTNQISLTAKTDEASVKVARDCWQSAEITMRLRDVNDQADEASARIVQCRAAFTNRHTKCGKLQWASSERSVSWWWTTQIIIENMLNKFDKTIHETKLWNMYTNSKQKGEKLNMNKYNWRQTNSSLLLKTSGVGKLAATGVSRTAVSSWGIISCFPSNATSLIHFRSSFKWRPKSGCSLISFLAVNLKMSTEMSAIPELSHNFCVE